MEDDDELGTPSAGFDPSVVRLATLGLSDTGKTCFKLQLLHQDRQPVPKWSFSKHYFETVSNGLSQLVNHVEEGDRWQDGTWSKDQLSQLIKSVIANGLEGTGCQKKRVSHHDRAILIEKMWRDYLKPIYKSKKHDLFWSENLDLLCENAKSFLSRCRVEDFVLTSHKSIGISSSRVDVEGLGCDIVDVGGTATERSKRWPHVKNNQQHILFFTSLSEFHLSTWEDLETNRLDLSLSTFQELLLDDQLSHCQFTLIFTKPDVLIKMITQEGVPFKSSRLNFEMLPELEGLRSDAHVNVVLNTIIKKFQTIYNKYRNDMMDYHIVQTISQDEISQVTQRMFGATSSAMKIGPFISPCLSPDNISFLHKRCDQYLRGEYNMSFSDLVIKQH